MIAKATVLFALLGFPMELVVQTYLEPDRTNDPVGGTHLCETFRLLALNGVTLPTPEHWKSTRDLEISYLDEDCMIARTSFGEPHLLLRQRSPCTESTEENDDEECDVNAVVTDFVQQALDKYGGTGKLTRKLVDRAYGSGTMGAASPEAVSSIPQIIHSIVAQVKTRKQ